jgi:hypothetical protein
MTPAVAETPPPEAFIMAECIAPTRERAAEVVRTTKQYLLHHGYEGRLSTGGNLAFPFTPPEVSIGPAYRFTFTISCGPRIWRGCSRWKSKRYSRASRVAEWVKKYRASFDAVQSRRSRGLHAAAGSPAPRQRA